MQMIRGHWARPRVNLPLTLCGCLEHSELLRSSNYSNCQMNSGGWECTWRGSLTRGHGNRVEVIPTTGQARVMVLVSRVQLLPFLANYGPLMLGSPADEKMMLVRLKHTLGFILCCTPLLKCVKEGRKWGLKYNSVVDQWHLCHLLTRYLQHSYKCHDKYCRYVSRCWLQCSGKCLQFGCDNVAAVDTSLVA